MSTDPYRLPRTVTPSAYKMVLEPDLNDETFRGQIEISCTNHQSISDVTLNAESLDITDASVTTSSGDVHRDCEVSLDPEAERITVNPGVELEPQDFTLKLSFEGVFNPQLSGWYISRYENEDGETQKLATTQFEPVYARKCFPCWDEPEFKATFEISLILEDELTAVSNAPEVKREAIDTELGSKTKIDFAKTMVMSTYLVAFVAGNLETTEPVEAAGTELRIVHVPQKGHLTSFALEVAAFALQHFTDYFALPYPGQKLDLVAIPDFAAGAMENLGCVTFREVVLLIDPDRATQPELQRAADVINHELAHMWFGDLVTMKWWNGLWLNEAFATFMEMRCTDAYKPQWNRWTDFGLSRTAAFDVDSLETTRPIEYEVKSPEDAEGMFDVLTYEKGAAVVRMLEQYVGEDQFRDGIRAYMKKHQFGNAETTDLWDCLETETGEPVRRIMDSWIFQGGYPLIELSQPDPSQPNYSVTQSTMSFLGGGEKTDQKWEVPIQYRTSEDEPSASHKLLLDQPKSELALESKPEWLLMNSEGAGFFRVAYPDDVLEELSSVAQTQLSPVERYAIVDDSWAAVLAGRQSTPGFLNLLEAMTQETDRSVWLRIVGGFSQLSKLTSAAPLENLQEIVRNAISPTLTELGLTPVEDDTEQQLQLRGDLIRAVGIVGNDPEIQEEAKRAVATGRRNPELVEASIFAAAVSVVADQGDESDFNDYVTSWEQAETPQSEIRFLSALADFPEPALIERLFEMVVSGKVRSQNGPLLLGRALTNKECGQTTWKLISNNWEKLCDLFSSNLVVRMVEGVTSLDKPDDQVMVSQFFETHSVPSGEKTLQQILEKQRVRVALREREQKRLEEFLLGSDPRV